MTHQAEVENRNAVGWTSRLRFFVLLLAACAPPAIGKPQPSLQEWLARNATPVRTIDPADEDFSDLEPLARAIGSSRAVMLGEVSHGAGANFSAKIRLIEFLHQRMGFDVVLWESGMYELRYTEAGIRGGEDPVAAAERGVFKVWTMIEQVSPLFRYAQKSQATLRPLEMAGFDLQFSVAKPEQFCADLLKFVQTVGPDDLRRRAAGFAGEACPRREKLGLPASGPAELDAFMKPVDGLLELMQRERPAFEQAHGAREVDFMTHAIDNFREQSKTLYDRRLYDTERGVYPPEVTSVTWNRRDAQNARTLRWQIEHYYPDRKVIVWAHNGHIMNAYYSADWSTLHDHMQPGGMKPMGAYLREQLGDEIYSIGLTGYAGTDRKLSGRGEEPIEPPQEGSLEERLHRLGKPCLFVDFRGLKNQPDHPLHQPQAMRIRQPGPAETMPDLTKVFDAVLYVDRMEAARRIEK